MKWSEVAQSCPTLCDPMDCSPPGSSVHGILQARILEWVAILFSRGSSQPRDRTQVSRIAGRCFSLWATRESWVGIKNALSLIEILYLEDFIIKLLCILQQNKSFPEIIKYRININFHYKIVGAIPLPCPASKHIQVIYSGRTLS